MCKVSDDFKNMESMTSPLESHILQLAHCSTMLRMLNLFFLQIFPFHKAITIFYQKQDVQYIGELQVAG